MTVSTDVSTKKTPGQWKADILVFLLCIAAALIVCSKIITDGIIYSAHDIWWHILWLQNFVGELKEGIPYPRWLGQSDYLHGSPILVFYPPFCFYLGALVQRISNLSAANVTTAVFTIGSFGSGFSFYLMSRKRWGSWSAAVGALILTTSPYLVIDMYVRGSVPEVLAMCWIPLVMLGVDGMQSKRGQLIMWFGFCMLALTHVPSLLIYTIAWFSRVLFCSIHIYGGRKRVIQNLLYASIGLGSAGIFLVPMLIERRYVNLDALLKFCGWLTDLIPLPFTGEIPFISGTTFCYIPDLAWHSCITALILYLLTFIDYKSRNKSSHKSSYEIHSKLREPAYWLILNLTASFFMSVPSRLIWTFIRILQMTQFPWRMMTVSIFCVSVLSALCLRELKSPTLKIIATAVIAVFLLHNVFTDWQIAKYRSGIDKQEPYMLAVDSRHPNDAFQNLVIEQNEIKRQKMPEMMLGTIGYPGVPEYNPLIGIAKSGTAAGATLHAMPESKPEPLTKLVEGVGSIDLKQGGSYWRTFSTESGGPKTGFKVSLRTYYYPTWHLYRDGHEQKLEQSDDGSILINAPPGKHDYILKYEETPDFYLGAAISILSLCILCYLLVFRARNRKAD